MAIPGCNCGFFFAEISFLLFFFAYLCGRVLESPSPVLERGHVETYVWRVVAHVSMSSCMFVAVVIIVVIAILVGVAVVVCS